MKRSFRRSGWTLALTGFLAVLFFWLSDPRLGPGDHEQKIGAFDWRFWLHELRSAPNNLFDASQAALPGTLVGVLGALAVMGMGLWLVTRRG